MNVDAVDTDEGVTKTQWKFRDCVGSMQGGIGAESPGKLLLESSPHESEVGSYGGSKPPAFQGLHRQIRQAPRHAPRIGPCFCTAWMKYSLQLGSNLQTLGSSGLSTA